MQTFSVRRTYLGLAILLTTLIAGCPSEPKPSPDNRASQVSSTGKPSAQKPSPSVAALSSAASIRAPKPGSVAASRAEASASAAAEPPAAPPDPSLDCDKLLTSEDLFAACRVKVEAPTDQPTDDIGTESTCSRRWSSKESGTVSVMVVRHPSGSEAMNRYNDFEVDLSKPEPIANVGDVARRYVKKGASGDPIFKAEAVKGRFNVVVFNPKITIGTQTVGPVCDDAGLEKALRKSLEGVP